MAGARITHEMITGFLVWARNYEEIISWEDLGSKAGSKRWKIVVQPGITATGDDIEDDPFFSILGPNIDRIVPHELVLTSREALVFGYGLAVAGLCRSRKEWTHEEWVAKSERRDQTRNDPGRKEAEERDRIARIEQHNQATEARIRVLTNCVHGKNKCAYIGKCTRQFMCLDDTRKDRQTNVLTQGE